MIENDNLEAEKMESQIHCQLFENCSDNSLSCITELQDCASVYLYIQLKINMLGFFKQ